MKQHDNPSPTLTAALPPDELRRQFLVSGLFQPGALNLHAWEVDRTILGAAIPLEQPLALPNPPEMRSTCFLERREIGIINLGGAGVVAVDGAEYPLEPYDALYVGRGVQAVTFRSANAGQPAQYYLLSYPAHTAHPTKHVAFKDAVGNRLGTPAGANQRTLYKLIHPGTMPTCQLVMGFTRLDVGSIWNTMPPHTHLRRSEVYLYFDVAADQAVFHFMGAPQATRHLVVHNCEAVLSPPWSIHSGAGTAAYAFVWGMGGENQVFSDMDPAPIAELR